MKKSTQCRVAIGAALLLFSYIFWQWRYEKVSQNLVPENACQHAQDWQGTTTAPTVSFSEDGLVIRKDRGGPSSSVFLLLGDLGDARHIAVKCDAAWEDCQRDQKVLWAMPRVVLYGRSAAGHFYSSADHGVVAARGTSKWHREHCVMEIPPGMIQPRISIDSYGAQGTLRVKNLQVEIVRPRGWSEKTGIILLACWVMWLAWNLHPFLRGRWCLLRSILLGSALLAAFTIFVYPQPRTIERTIGLQFWLGNGPTAPPAPVDVAQEPSIVINKIAESSTVNPPAQPKAVRLRTISPTDQNAPITPPPSQALPSAPVLTPVPIVIDPPSRWEAWRASARERLMEMDRKWNFRSYNLTHFTSFFAISLCVLLLARRARLLWLIAAMAVSAEIIPEIVHDIGDSGDFYDLLANTLGILSALFLHQVARFFIHQRRKKHLAKEAELEIKS